jgi:hypothetical protein
MAALRVTFVLLGVVLALAPGCASTRVTNVTEGRGLPVGANPEIARNATLRVQVTEKVPAGAEVIGPIEAGRGHRDVRNDKPTEADVINDLKLAAYARGADGIAEVKFQTNTGLSDNFWWVLQGRAVAWRAKN